MSLISKNKAKLIGLLKFFNAKPVFRRLFYHIHEIRKDVLTTDRFLAVLVDEGFFIGTYNYHRHRMWRRLAEETFEGAETQLIKKIVPHFNYFIDIGAHIGYYTCLVHHLAPDMPVLSFEPNPENFQSLKKNIELNRIQNSKIFQVGLGERKEKAILYGTDAVGSIVKESYDTSHLPADQVTVEIDRLDVFIKEIPTGANVFMKVDVEGNEFNMLKGAGEFIMKIQPIGIMMEVCKQWSVQKNPHFLETFKRMKDFGYEAYAITEHGVLEKVPDPQAYRDIGSFLFLRKDLHKLPILLH